MNHCIKQFARRFMCLVTCTLLIISTNAQEKDHYNVAIFLYQGVELLDFAGPGEVFAATQGFKVYTVSVDGKEILSQRFVTVKPEYSIENAPSPDIIVFPGGNTYNTSKDKRVLDWVNQKVVSGTMAMSVCSGAAILANAGLLENLNVTTFHGFIPGLQKMLPNSKVLANTRFVDNGNIITTAGVSAGIDGALHVVSRIKGMDVAKATAFYMEYDKWKPEEGRKDYKNAYFKQAGLMTSASTKDNTAVTAIPYEGELKNFAIELWNNGMYEQEALMLEDAIKWYPNSASLYNHLSHVYAKLGKPAPIDEEGFIKIIEEGKVDEAISIYEKAAIDYPGWKIFNEDVLNTIAYGFMQKEDYANAIKIFQLNVKTYPKSSNVYDSLAEGYMKAGNKKEAIANYKKSLEIDPGNTNAENMIKSML